MKKAPRTSRFRPKGDDRHHYLLSDIPGPLWRKMKRAAKKRNVSVRALLLHYFEAVEVEQ